MNILKSTMLIAIGTIALTSCVTQKANLLNPDDKAFNKKAPDSFHVVMETTKGTLKMEVKRAWSPNGVDRFYNLVVNGYYNNLPIFRISRGNWAQFGVAGDPKVAQAWRHKNIPDDPRVLDNVRGTVAFAFKDPNARTTQMFVSLKDNRATHDKEPFVPFARITEGMEVADAWYDGYGEKAGGGIRGGKQDVIFEGGNEFWKKNFPLLDYITRTRIEK